ncbi:MAG: 16S rRNA (cytidine(1402)-2'-O)-methyltransferase [Bacteriovoracaceae bacterium]
MSGLTLLTVPIGNTGDITLRAKDRLEKCSVIVAEDTRVIKELLQRLGIEYQSKHIISFHDRSETHALQGLLKLMRESEVVYVSDAGSPLISDPALPLIHLAIEHQVKLETLPGPTSVMAALELSGLPAIPFHFHGFLGRDTSKLNEFVNTASSQYGSHIFFEGVSRIKKTLKSLGGHFPEWDFAVCRELTKTHQSVYRFKGKEYGALSNDIVEKGEFVVLLRNPEKKIALKSAAADFAWEIMEKGAKPKLLAKLLSELTGLSSKDVYSKLDQR